MGLPNISATESTFDNAPSVHHRNPIGSFGDNTQIMSNQDDGHLALHLQAVEQFHNLRLHCYIQSGR